MLIVTDEIKVEKKTFDRAGASRFRRPHRKSCKFCMDKINYIDYKEYNRLKNFITDRGKIIPSRITGTCSRHQRALTLAINRARNIALLPFMVS